MNVPFDLVSIDFDSIIAGRFCSGELGRVAYPCAAALDCEGATYGAGAAGHAPNLGSRRLT
jgi:hypothetical protein